MMTQTFSWRADWRWLVVASLTVLFIILTDLSMGEISQLPNLGIRTTTTEPGVVVAWVQPAGLAWDAGVRPGDVVESVEGRKIVGPFDPTALSTAGTVEFRSPTGTHRTVSTSLAAPVSMRRQLSFLVVAICFFVLGSVAFVLSVDRGAATAMLAFASAAAVALVTAIASPFGSTWALGLEYFAVIGFGASTFLLFLVFPLDRLSTHRGRVAAWTCAGLHALLVVAYLAVLTSDSAAYELLRRLVFATLALDFGGSGILILLAVIETQPARHEARQIVLLVTLGTVAGFAPFCLLILVPPLIGQRYMLPPDTAILSVVLLPVSLGAAIVSRRLLGITRLVRRGLVALTVWLLLLGLYSFAFIWTVRIVDAQRSDGRLSMGYVAVVVVAVIAGTFPTIQLWLRSKVERMVFRDVYDYAATLHDLGTETSRLTSPEAISHHVLGRLGKTLDLTWATLVLRSATPRNVVYQWSECPVDVVIDLERLNWDECTDHRPRQFLDNLHLGSTRRKVDSAVPLVADGDVIGAVVIGLKRQDLELLPGDRMLVATVAPLVAANLQSASLVSRLEEQIDALADRERSLAALSEKLIEVQEAERLSIARDLHDDPLQRAILLTRELRNGPLDVQTERWRQEVEEIIVSLRAICTGLRPVVLDDLGLVGGLEWLTTNLSARSDLTVSLVVESDNTIPFGRLPSSLEIALYRVAQEALNNCLKHAQASQITVTVRRNRSRVSLLVVDDGRGYSRGQDTRSPHLRLGILGMREQLRPWRGQLAVENWPGGGTIVRAEVLIGEDDDRQSA
jgi:signal transduction histidine kinase